LVEASLNGSNEGVYGIPATEMAEEMGKPFVVNMVMLGALTKLLPKLHYPKVEAEIMGGFSASIAGPNLEAYEKGYRFMEQELLKK
jgi:Pyruvate/2-oxoacid:ferredoxin oxidoreductase gamma subunit